MHKREHERHLLKRKLLAGVSINMPAPRRIGKTWTINKLAEDLRADGWVAVELDVEGTEQPKEFAKRLCTSVESQLSTKETLKSHFLQRFKNVVGGDWSGNPADALSQIEPVDFLETLISSLNESEEKSVILIDEIAYFFLKCAERDKDDAYKFAYNLRRIQQNSKKVRWLLTGSIGLNVVAKRYGLGGAFVDFETFKLEPFNKDEAKSYLRDPDTQSQLNCMFDASDEDFDSMFEILGWLAPYYLKLVANETRPSTDNQVATLDDFMRAFDRLLQPGRDTEFSIWKEHIEKNLAAEDQDIAIEILNLLCNEQNGETIDTIFSSIPLSEQTSTRKQIKQVITILMNDGLIHCVGERYQFRSGLVRRYWAEYEAD